MNRVVELMLVEARVGATPRIHGDVGQIIVRRRLEATRAPPPDDVDRRRDRGAVDVRRLRPPNELRRAERLPHAQPKLLHDLVDVRTGEPVPARRPSYERVESPDDVFERAR